jgi:hypothetical protein
MAGNPTANRPAPRRRRVGADVGGYPDQWPYPHVHCPGVAGGPVRVQVVTTDHHLTDSADTEGRIAGRSLAKTVDELVSRGWWSDGLHLVHG